MVGYNDTYNRALTARSNALQRRKGQMIDRLNGSGRGDDNDSNDDDYLSEDDSMEGGGAYEDEYEDEMVGGSFEEASRDVGGIRTGGRATGGFAFLPFLASAAAPVVGNLISRLFGGAYTGGKRQIKAAMLRDLKAGLGPMRGSARFLPAMRDAAFDVGTGVMRDARYRPPMVAEGGMPTGGRATGGRATGGFAFLAPLAMMAAPQIGQAIGRMFGLGRNSPIMRGHGFFDNLWSGIKSGAQSIGNLLKPVAEAVLPVARDLAKDAAVGFIKKKVGGKKCCSCGGAKQSPYRLAYGYGGAMLAKTANAAAHHHSENRDFKNAVGETIHGADRLDRERRYALGAGGKRLYMSGGTAPLAAMGQESLGGFDNDEQPYGLTPPRNVATRGYIQGGQRYLTPEDQMRPTIGGQRGGASAWITHVKAYAAKHGCSYKDALSQASATYRK